MTTVQGHSSGITAVALTDAELTALALAADPDAPLASDAVPINQVLGERDGLLPEWYMPTPMAHGTSRTRVALIALVILASLVIPAAGLCITYGTLTLA